MHPRHPAPRPCPGTGRGHPAPSRGSLPSSPTSRVLPVALGALVLLLAWPPRPALAQADDDQGTGGSAAPPTVPDQTASGTAQPSVTSRLPQVLGSSTAQPAPVPTGLGTSINPAFGVGLPATPGVVPGTTPRPPVQATQASGQLTPAAPASILQPAIAPGLVQPGGLSALPASGGTLPDPNAVGLALPVTLGNSFVLPATGILPLSGAVPGDTAIAGGYTGNVRAQVEGALGLEPASTPGLIVVPGLGLQELLTDNVNPGTRPRVADIVTTISPSILIGADTQRLQASIAYAPNIQLYATTGRQDQVDHELNAQATATLVPDLLFLDLRGFATQQSTAGGYGLSNQPYYSESQRTQTTSFSVSPYVVHRLGDLLQVRAGYSLSYVDQSGNPYYGLLTPGLSGLNAAQLAALEGENPSFRGNSTIANREFVTLSTTPELGRLSSTLQLSAEQDSGTGVLDGAHRNEAVEDVAYALSRTVALLGRIGYQDVLYSGIPVTRIEQGVYGVGLRLTPNPASAVVVRYGHHDGFDSAFLNASYALTARTRIFAGYSEGLTTDQEQIADVLGDSVVDGQGVTLDGSTAAPLVIGDSLLGYQNSLYRLRRFSATGVTTYDRDSLSASVLYEKRSLVASGIGYAGYSDSGVSGILSWSHVLDDVTSSLASAQYGTHRIGSQVSALLPAQTGTQNTFSLTAGLSRRLTQTLLGTVQYTLTNQSSSGGAQGYLQNIVLVGLRQTF